MKQLSEMNLLDDFLFEEVMSDKENGAEIARILLSTILDRPVETVTVEVQKNLLPRFPGKHGIRMDVQIRYLDKCKNSATIKVSPCIANIEPNTYRDTDKLRRARYYHSLADTKLLSSGKPYSDLVDVCVIMILPYDPFGYDRMVYTVKNQCIEEPQMPYDDGQETIFLYTKGKKKIPSQKLKDMLQYFQDSSDTNIQNKDIEKIANAITKIKADAEVGERYMSMYDFIQHETQEARQKGYEEGCVEGREEGREKGRTEAFTEECKNLRELILTALTKYGSIPDFLILKIQQENNRSTLKQWTAKAICSNTIPEFLEKANIKSDCFED